MKPRKKETLKAEFVIERAVEDAEIYEVLVAAGVLRLVAK